MKKLAFVFLLAAIAVFYLVFFKLAPYVASTIPAGEWQGFMRIVVYIFLGWVGGVGIPIVLVILGLGAFCND